MAFLQFIKPIALDEIVAKHKDSIRQIELWMGVFEHVKKTLKAFEGKVINIKIQKALEAVLAPLFFHAYVDKKDRWNGLFMWEIKITMDHRHPEDIKGMSNNFYFQMDFSSTSQYNEAAFLKLADGQYKHNVGYLAKNMQLSIDQMTTSVQEWNDTMENLKRINETFQGTCLEYEFDITRYKH